MRGMTTCALAAAFLAALCAATPALAEQAWTTNGTPGAVAKYSADASTITASSIYDTAEGVTTTSSMTIEGRLIVGSTQSVDAYGNPFIINTNARFIPDGWAQKIRHLYSSSNGILIDIMDGTGIEVNMNGSAPDTVGAHFWPHNGYGVVVEAGANSDPKAYFKAVMDQQYGGHNPVFLAEHTVSHFSSDVFKAEMGLDGQVFDGNFLNFRNLQQNRMLVSPTGYLWTASSATFGGSVYSAGLDSSDSVNIAANKTYSIGGASIDAPGTLSNVAYKSLDNTYTGTQTFQAGANLATYSGKVGIGTAAPSAMLHVSSSWPSVYSFFAHAPNIAGESRGAYIMGGTNSNDISLLVENALGTQTYLDVRGDGRIGIGTPIPTAVVHISTAVNDLFALNVANSGSRNHSLGVRINAGSTTNDTPLVVGNRDQTATYFYVQGDGKVGVGDQIPVAMLQVSSTTDDTYGLLVERLANTTGHSYGASIKAGTNSSDTSLLVQNSAGTQTHLLVRGDGRVGIGTAEPAATLAISSTADGLYGIRLSNAGPRAHSYGALINAGSTHEDTALLVRNSAQDTVYFNVQGDGKVGIGSTIPSAILHISSTTDDTYGLAVERPANTTGHSYGASIKAGTNSSDIALAVKNAAASQTFIHVQGDGKVGVGISTPTATLDVGGNMNIRMRDYNGNPMTINLDLAIHQMYCLVQYNNGYVTTIRTPGTSTCSSACGSISKTCLAGVTWFDNNNPDRSEARYLDCADTDQRAKYCCCR